MSYTYFINMETNTPYPYLIKKANQMSDKALTLEECKDIATRGRTDSQYNTYNSIESWIGNGIGIHVPLMILHEAAELYKESALEAQKGEIVKLCELCKTLKSAMVKGDDLYDSLIFEGEPLPKRLTEIKELKGEIERLKAENKKLINQVSFDPPNTK
jgi:hypothetical protein